MSKFVMIISGGLDSMESLCLLVVSPSNIFAYIPKGSASCLIFDNWSLARAFVGYTKIANTFLFALILDLQDPKSDNSSKILCKTGIQNASVLPDAVGATTTMSFPSKKVLTASS